MSRKQAASVATALVVIPLTAATLVFEIAQSLNVQPEAARHAMPEAALPSGETSAAAPTMRTETGAELDGAAPEPTGDAKVPRAFEAERPVGEVTRLSSRLAAQIRVIAITDSSDLPEPAAPPSKHVAPIPPPLDAEHYVTDAQETTGPYRVAERLDDIDRESRPPQ
ncbi:hypothetical protein OAS39_11590 [Pirellulales bacterium]|nr:hypothetical protein [Pirellulales bacterium]